MPTDTSPAPAPASIGMVCAPTPAWTSALSVGCPRHRVGRDVPCWSLPSDTRAVGRSHAAVCAGRLHAAQAVQAGQARAETRRLIALAEAKRGRGR